MTSDFTTAVIVGTLAAATLVAAVYILVRGYRARRRGALVSTDLRGEGATLFSSRYQLYGRPDQVRRLPDGRSIPVEFKSRAPPLGGVPYSHRIQVGAYCLLLEETTGIPPPFGLVRYAGGVEVRVFFDDELRADVLRIRRQVVSEYDGRATPSVGRCRRCPWRPGCDQALSG